MIIKNTKTRTLNASDVKEIQKSLDELTMQIEYANLKGHFLEVMQIHVGKIAEILGLEINQD
jgi:hypothetical protein